MSLEALNKALRGISVAQDAAEETNGLDPHGKWITTKDTHKKIHIDRNGHPDGGNPYSVAAANGTLEKSGDGEEIPSAEVRGGRVVWPKKVGDKVRLPNGNILTRTGRGEGEGNVRVRRPLKEGDLVVRIGKGGGKFKVVKAETDVDAQKDKYELVGSDKKEKIVHAWTGKPISEWRKTDHGKAEDACGCGKAEDDGTSEGAKKGWETRRHGGTGVTLHSPEHEHLADLVHEFVKARNRANSLQCEPGERYRSASKAEALGSEVSAEWTNLYGHAPEHLYHPSESVLYADLEKKPLEKGEKRAHGFSDAEVEAFLNHRDCPYKATAEDIHRALNGEIDGYTEMRVERKIPIEGHPGYKSLMGCLHPIIQAIVKKNNIVRRS